MMDTKSKREISYPLCLSLRVHSSVLLPELEGETSNGRKISEDDVIFVPNEIALGVAAEKGGNHVVEFDGKESAVQDGCVCTREEHTSVSHVFQIGEGRMKEQTIQAKRPNDPFEYVTAITSLQRIVVQPSADAIKELGRRARARTEQERQNRKGIKVIDESTLILQQQKEGTKSGFSNIASLNVVNGKKRQHQQKQRNSYSQKRNNAVKKPRRMTQLLWTPDLSQISIPEKIDQSAYVLVHGLPYGCTLEVVRKFFTGLVPEQILLLLTNQTDIWELDASSYDTLALYNLQDDIYTNEDVRVLVKFDSASAAGLAVDRSGETIFSKHLLTSERSSHSVDLPDEFSIGVTQISKKNSSFLSRLSIDATPGVPFHDCLYRVESKLDPMVIGILWSSTRKACHFSVDCEIKRFRVLLEEDTHQEDRATNRLLSFSGYQKHAKHYNRLLRIQEDLMQNIPIDCSEEATTSTDPVVRLTAHACSVLEDEMDRVDILLYQYRASRFL